MTAGNIGEIFNSIQGEGIFNGIRQVFVRFCGCPLTCGYCDTPLFRQMSADCCRVQRSACSRKFHEIPSPVDKDKLIEIVSELWSPATRHISLTGGEPLLHAGFINSVSKEVDYPLYLETNGCLPDAANEVRNAVDIAACDIKLPEHNAAEDYMRLLRAELETVNIFHDAGAVTFTKVVVTDKTADDSVKIIASSLSETDQTIPLLLQPVTACKGFEPPSPVRLLELMDIAGEYLEDVRAIPQVHKMIGQL